LPIPKNKKIRVIGAAGDPGGSRALLPVFERLYNLGIEFGIFEHGFLNIEAPSYWPRIPCPERDMLSAGKIFDEDSVSAFIFGSSIKDNFPLLMARMAKEKKIPVIHVLDHWTNYINRLKIDDQITILPDIYTVIDQRAFEQAFDSGIPSSILRITGQPAFSSISDEYESLLEEAVPERGKTGNAESSKKRILFVSEPVSEDQGSSPLSPHYRGYTETEVISLLCRLLQPYESLIILEILPHPREDISRLNSIFREHRGRLETVMLDLSMKRRAIHSSDGVIGMASILLYEAWLNNKPVMSLQPGFRRKDLAFMKGREGCLFLSETEGIEKLIDQWIHETGEPRNKKIIQKDIQLHKDAAKAICDLLLNNLQ